MTRYDAYPDHPLNGVPQEVLDVARIATDAAEMTKDLYEGHSRALADAVVSHLHGAGFITWPGKIDADNR